MNIMNIKRDRMGELAIVDVLRRFAFIFFMALILIAGITFTLYMTQARNEHQFIENREIANAAFLSKTVARNIESAISDLFFIAGLHAENASSVNFRNALSLFMRNKREYAEIICADTKGREKVHMKLDSGNFVFLPDDRLANISGSPHFQKTVSLAPDRVYISDPATEMNEEIMVYLGMPIIDRTGRKTGVLIAGYSGKPIVDNFRRLSTDYSTRYFLVDRDGSFLKGIGITEEQNPVFQGKPGNRFAEIYPGAWHKITSQPSGQFQDASGLFTFTTFFPLLQAIKTAEELNGHYVPSAAIFDEASGYFWKVVSFVPSSALLISSSKFLGSMLYYDIAVILFIFLISWIIARISVRRDYVEKALRTLTVTDELTGLYNRRGFFLLAEQQMKLAKRAGICLILIFVDIDNFKLINDTYGHDEGDRTLAALAGIFKKTFRESDIIARVGGDEFIVLAADSSKSGVNLFVDRFLANIQTYNEANHLKQPLSVSIGTACYDKNSDLSIDQLITMADRLMYQQKKSRSRQESNS